MDSGLGTPVPSGVEGQSPWPCLISCTPGLPYFLTGAGESWTPIGQNDAITWPELAPLFARRDLPAVEAHLRWLKSQGVTCLRLMLEYCHREHRYFERPAGCFVPSMVQLWDDLFMLLERVGLRVLLTPYDTFFMWIRWSHHPYNKRNGGPCADRRDWLTDPAMRAAAKARLQFASDRWGGSPALFAWDIWNEMHPAQARDNPAHFTPFITDIATWLREYERRRHGRAHPLTASIFGPKLLTHPATVEPIFRHPALDFANIHLYEHGTIDDPADTVAAALAVGRLMRQAVQDTPDLRPMFDSEHGPIHRFKDKHVTLKPAFDDEYFRHMQWAHLASGGAGGGMRWPNRNPHVLTHGMRQAQRALHDFLPLLDWTRFRRRNLNQELAMPSGVACCACGDATQALIWLIRTDTIGPNGTLRPDAPAKPVRLAVPGLDPGRYDISEFDTRSGQVAGTRSIRVDHAGDLVIDTNIATDLALAVTRRGIGPV